MLRLSSKWSWIVRAAVLAGVCACSSSDPTSPYVIKGTISGTLTGYGPWIGQTIVTATALNGALEIIGQDQNFKKITLHLVGVDLNATQQHTPRTIAITTATADTTGYVVLYESTLSGEYRYNTFEGGSATVVLTHVAPDRVTGTFEFTVQLWPTGSALPPGGAASRSLTGGVFDIKPTGGNP